MQLHVRNLPVFPRLKTTQILALAGLIFASFGGVLGDTSEPVRIISTAAEVRMLSGMEASKELPVHLHGIYMGEADPEGIAFILQDATEAIYVQAPAESLIGIGRGDLLELEGVSNPGGFAPIVLVHKLVKTGVGKIPEPRQVTLDELYAGQLDGQWVEFSGIIRSVEPKVSTDLAPPPPGTQFEVPSEHSSAKPPEVKMKVASGLGRVMVEVNGPIDPDVYVDAEVRLQCLCFNLHNRNRQYVKPFVQVPLGAEITIQKQPAIDLWDGEPQTIGNLLRFGRRNDSQGHRVHIRGVVVHHRPGVVLWVRDGDDCLRVESKQTELLQPGDTVDVLGFPVPGEYSPILEDAVFRKRASNLKPVPTKIPDVSSALRNDANLVQFEARLVEARLFHGGVELTLDALDQTIRAHLYQPENVSIPSTWQPGSIVCAAGVCEVIADQPGPLGGLWIPHSFQLLLRSPEDITILQPPPWWNAERIAWMLSGFLLLALAFIALIVWISRRRVQDQEHRRAMAEAEFSAILKERNRVAREIHDTLSQSLSSISLQLELARTHADELSNEVRGHLGTAHQLTRDALKEARNSIWNMRSHVLEHSDLGEALTRISKQLTSDSDVESVVKVEGLRRRLSPMLENNLLRIGQEAVTNAAKHASPKHIEVNLDFERRRIRLSVKDDGVGFVVKDKPQSNKGSFGLVGIRERVELLGGTVQVISAPGKGTELKVEVPV